MDGNAFLRLLLFAGAFVLLWRWKLTFESPQIFFSHVQKNEFDRGRGRYAELPFYLKMGALILFALAFLDPHFFVEKEKNTETLSSIEKREPSEGLAIYLVLDQSGSMSQNVTVMTPEGHRMTLSKMDLLKRVTREFIQSRKNDMLGLVTFARGAQVLSPLTLDHDALLEQLKQLDFVKEEELDGTSIGYAIYKAANLIGATRHYAEEDSAYEMKDSVMILVTDGLQSPSPLDQGKRLRTIDLEEAAEYAKENEIKLYVINVEPRIASAQFALQRKVMERVAAATGGKFYLTDETVGLEEIYQEINQLEKSQLPSGSEYLFPPKSMQPNLYKRVSFYPYLIALGMISLLLSVILEGVILRRVP